MDVYLQPGRYVVAVSGGVDSVTLLHMLAQRPDLRLTVAHFDHGIREDSSEDRELVQTLAREYGLPFVFHVGNLGPEANEALARRVRYDFLHKVRRASGAQAIVTAHHQDDVLETAILNLLRGTNRRGLSSLRSMDTVKRPLANVSKKELIRYAELEGLRWREDSTNSDERYARNYIRLRIMPRFTSTSRKELLAIIQRATRLNEAIFTQLINYLHIQPARDTLDRHGFIMLPHLVSREVMAEWLLQNTGAELTKNMLERLVHAAKTGKTGSKIDVDKDYWLEIGRTRLALKLRER